MENENIELDPLLIMEEIIDKLKLLDYESQFTRTKGLRPLSRSYFAIKSTNQAEQFMYFSSLCIWLLSLNGIVIAGDKKYDDPVTTATNILTEMKNLGITIDLPPNKLKNGYGDSICLVLIKLVDSALKKKNSALKKVKSDSNDKADKQQFGTGNIVEIEEESPDLINVDIDFGDNIKEEKNKYDSENNNNNQQEAVSEILTSDIPQEEWQREVERVTSKIKIDYGASNFITGEWRTHLEQIKLNETSFSKAIPDARGVLETLSNDIDKNLEKISKKEAMISRNFSNIITDYKGRQKATTDQLEEYNMYRERVNKLQYEMTELDERITGANYKFENFSKAVSDTSSVGTIKNAIQNLSNELLSMDVKVRILNSTILKHKLNSTHYHITKEEGIDHDLFDEEI